LSPLDIIGQLEVGTEPQESNGLNKNNANTQIIGIVDKVAVKLNIRQRQPGWLLRSYKLNIRQRQLAVLQLNSPLLPAEH